MKIFAILVLCASFSTSSFALFGRASITDKENLAKAIKADDGASVAEILKSVTTDEQYGELSDGFGHHLLGLATFLHPENMRNPNDHSFICSPKSVEAVLRAGGKASETKNVFKTFLKQGHLSGSIISYCPSSVKLLLPLVELTDAVNASQKFEILDQFANDEKIAPRIIETAKELKSFFEPKCKSGDQASCVALEGVLNKVKAFAAREDESRFLETPKGKLAALKADSCRLLSKIDQNRSYINHQKKIGKEVGVVNAKVLYESANRIEIYKNELANLERQIKAEGGKVIKNPEKECQ